jgi:hypothetical protein
MITSVKHKYVLARKQLLPSITNARAGMWYAASKNILAVTIQATK